MSPVDTLEGCYNFRVLGLCWRDYGLLVCSKAQENNFSNKHHHSVSDPSSMHTSYYEEGS
jgi:hypothetical protein